MRKFAILLALCAGISGGVALAADAQQLTVKQQQMQLADALVAAGRAHDKARFIALVHPALRACSAANQSEYYDFVTMIFFKDFPTGKYSRVEIQPIAATDQPITWLAMPRQQFPYPVRPKVRLQIDYDDIGNGQSQSEDFEAAPGPSGWYLAVPCPTDAGIVFLRKYIADANAQQAKVAAMAAKVPPALRDKVLKLWESGHQDQAIKAYQNATGSSSSIAMVVINKLEEQQTAAHK